MTRWIEDSAIPAPDDHQWQRPVPDDCPNCPCHTTRVCEHRAWAQADRPTHAAGTPYTKPCPCETAAT